MPTLAVTDPFDHSPLGEVALQSLSEVMQRLDTAHRLHLSQRHGLPAHERVAILKRTAELMQAEQDHLAWLIAAEGGKPLVDARIEVARAIDGVQICASELGALGGHEIPMGLTGASARRVAFTTREPIGVVVAVSAFNHPLNLIVHQVAPAVAVGCPVIVKPADDTPLSCQRFIALLHQAGLPSDWAQMVCCDTATAQALVTDSRVAFFSFIGSAKVGWTLRSLLAPGTRCALEHGGAAPVLVGASADVVGMLPKLVKGGFYHSGQVCVSVQRVLVAHDRANEVAHGLADLARALVVGHATDAQTECGPLIRPREVERVAAWVDEAVRAGAQALCGGSALSATTYAPTVLLNAPADSRVVTQEIFGPVVCVNGVASMDEAMVRANALPYAFQAAVFSNDWAECMALYRGLDASAVMVNDHTAFRIDAMPFAGRRQSGLGVGGIGHTMYDMTQAKMLVMGV